MNKPTQLKMHPCPFVSILSEVSDSDQAGGIKKIERRSYFIYSQYSGS